MTMTFQIHCSFAKTAFVLALLSLTPLAARPQTSTGTNSANASQTTNWKTVKPGKHLTVRVNPDADLSRYTSVTVGSIAYTGPSKKLKPQESTELVSLLHDSLAKDLSTTKLGPDSTAAGTLTLSADITKVKRSHPLLNVVTIAAVFVPLDLGGANVTASLVDEKTGQVVAEIESVGCGQIYQVLGSLRALGQSKIALKKQSRSIAGEITRMYQGQPRTAATNVAMSMSK
jgi:hypothetical protein